MKRKRLTTPMLLGSIGCSLLLITLFIFIDEDNQPSAPATPHWGTIIPVLSFLLIALAACTILAGRFMKWLGAQKAILLCATLAFVLCGIFPPWLSYGRAADYSFILLPPVSGRLDFSRLVVEWLCVGAIASMAWIFTARASKGKDLKGQD